MLPVRILHVFASLDRGGAESRVMDLYTALDRGKIQFDFVVMGEGSHAFDREIERMGGRKFVVRNPRQHGLLAHALDLIRIVQRHGPFHGVHSHTSYHSGLILALCWLLGIKRRIAHARTTGFNQSSWSNRLMLQVGRLLINCFATARLAISREAAEFLFGRGALVPGGAEVVPNAIPLQRFSSTCLSEVKAWRSALGLGERDWVLGHVGRFSKVKNHEFLLHVIRDLHAQGCHAVLVCAGGGELLAVMERRAVELGLGQAVRFVGVREDVPTMLGAIDLFLMPSLYEGLGGAAIEAQAAGLTCLLSDRCPEEVDLGIGLVRFLPINDPAVWSDALMRLGKPPRRPFAEVEAAFMEKGFTIQAAIRGFTHAYGLTTQDVL